jgi:hypothetical protein
MKNNSRVYNLVGGIALLLYAGYAIFGLIKGIMTNGMNMDLFLSDIHYTLNFMYSPVAVLLFLVLGTAGIMLIVDTVRNNEENQQGKLSVKAISIALICLIPVLIALIFWASYWVWVSFFTNGNMSILPVVVDSLGIIVVIGLYVVNKNAVAEFINSKIRVEPVKKPLIITILHCIGGGLLSAVIFYPAMSSSNNIYAAWADIIPFAILILAAVSAITGKIVGDRTSVIVHICALYLLAVLEYALIIGGSGAFFMADGIDGIGGVGWLILKVAGAALVLFYQLLLVSSSFRYFNEKFGAFTTSLLIGAAAILTAGFAVLTAIMVIVIAIVAVIGFVILKIVLASSGRSASSSSSSSKDNSQLGHLRGTIGESCGNCFLQGGGGCLFNEEHPEMGSCGQWKPRY